MVTLAPADKIKAKIMLAQAKADQHAAYQLKLKNELELEEAKGLDNDTSSELSVSEMR